MEKIRIKIIKHGVKGVLNIIVVCLLGFSTHMVYSDSLQSEFIRAYDASDYANAVSFMKQMVAQAPNATNYYNLANAYYRNQQLGHAVASYLKARQLAPLDKDIKANLDFIKSRLVDSLETEYVSTLDMFLFWNFFINKKTSLLVLGVLVAISELFLFLFLIGRRKRWVKVGIWVSIVLTALMLTSTIAKFNQPTWSALIEDTASVYSSPNESSTVLFELHLGAPVMIEDGVYDSNWYKIKLSDEKEGFIQAQKLLVYSSK